MPREQVLMFRLMATQEILQHLLSHTLKVYNRFWFVVKRDATQFDFVQAMLMSAYGSFKRRSNSSIKGWQTGSYLKYFHFKFLQNLADRFRSQIFPPQISSESTTNFTTRDQLEQEVNNLRSNLANLEALQHNTKVSCKTNSKYVNSKRFLKTNCSPRTTWWWPSRRWRSWGRSWAGWGQRAPATCSVRIKP